MTLQIKKEITSVEIAEIAKKNHKDVLESIREMAPDWEKVSKSKFRESEYEDKSGRMLPMYVLNKNECLYISSKYNNIVRAQLVLNLDESDAANEELVNDKKRTKELYEERELLGKKRNTTNARIREIDAELKDISLRDYSQPSLFNQK